MNGRTMSGTGITTREKFGVFTDRAGFTLIEILVASAIASIILVIVYTSYRSIVQSIKKATGNAEFYENVNLAISKIDTDISNTYYARNNKKTFFVSEESAGNNNCYFITVNHNTINFTGDPAKPCPAGDIQEIGYYLKADKSTQGLFSLIKHEKPYYWYDPLTGGTDNILLRNVVSLKFEFLKGNDWDELWDSRQNSLFPRAVKTTLVVKNYQSQDETFEFTSLINLREFR
jgi:type II secretion system protein J